MFVSTAFMKLVARQMRLRRTYLGQPKEIFQRRQALFLGRIPLLLDFGMGVLSSVEVTPCNCCTYQRMSRGFPCFTSR